MMSQAGIFFDDIAGVQSGREFLGSVVVAVRMCRCSSS